MGFYTPKEVSEQLKLEINTVYEYIRMGKLPAAKFGNRYRIEEEDLAAFVHEAKQRNGEQSAPGVGKGRGFFDRTPDAETLAIEQGVKPVTDLEALLGDFWPEEETADDFLAAVRRWRSEGEREAPA